MIINQYYTIIVQDIPTYINFENNDILVYKYIHFDKSSGIMIKINISLKNISLHFPKTAKKLNIRLLKMKVFLNK